MYCDYAIEWLKHEVKRRSDVVGYFSNPRALIRLVGAIIGEQHTEWQTEWRYWLMYSGG